MSLSGMNSISVPLVDESLTTLKSSISSPLEKSTSFFWPSLIEKTLNDSDNAFTAFVPTPFKPIDFLNASESYLPPVFIWETHSKTFPSGIPLP